MSFNFTHIDDIRKTATITFMNLKKFMEDYYNYNNQMKDQTIKQYSNMIDYCTLKLREDWANGADPIKLIGLADELGLTDLSLDFIDQLKESKELEQTKSDYLIPTELKTFGGH